MERDIIKKPSYLFSESAYLLDNLEWQSGIKRMQRSMGFAVSKDKRSTLIDGELPLPLLEEEPDQKLLTESLRLEQEAKERAFEIKKIAQEEAREILKQVELEAEKIRKEAGDFAQMAKNDAEKLKQEALSLAKTEGMEEGRKNGYQRGYNEGLALYQRAIQRWEELLQGIERERDKIYEDLRPLLFDLVGVALYRCLKEEAAGHAAVVRRFVEEALAQVRGQQKLKLHLNPEDVQEIEKNKNEIKANVGIGSFEIIPDNRIEMGGCLLETETGLIDANFKTVAEKVRETLKMGDFDNLGIESA